jgi:glycerol-3-phosphate dehydrogenase
MNPETPYDLLVIGGGVNGCGIARDAAGRGLSVLLVEQNDLASATSSSSTKLIHGGLRYLEHYEFRLVREALAERDVLLDGAPHIMWPMRFVLPHDPSLRPVWMIRAGLFLYDHLGWMPGRKSRLPGSHTVDLSASAYGRGLRPGVPTGFVYSDGWVDDARLVALCARQAADLGADIRVRTQATAARREGGLWRASLSDRISGQKSDVAARAVVNAAGPWVMQTLSGVMGSNAPAAVKLVKGSHIVVPRQYEGDHAFILQNDDRRIVFVIPYEERFTLIGTTDVVYDGDPGRVAISPAETDYLCAAVNRFLARPVAPGDVVWSYAGVRPLYDDGASNASETTRDYVLSLDGGGAAGAPALSIFGGKITTFRRLAEHALEKLSPFFPAMKPAWTSTAKLPGGELDGIDGDFAGFVSRLGARFGFVPEAHLRAMARRQGGRALKILGGSARIEDLGPHFGAGLYGREVDLMVGEEWARTPNDILFRRSKLGLHIGLADQAALGSYLAEKHGLGRVPA